MVEVIATTVADAIKIELGGAGRIELVSALSEGGLTPSYEMMQAVINNVSIPVNVMIRPHANSFFYTPTDLAVMQQDIAVAKKMGANGVVFGVLTEAQQNIDEVILQKLLAKCENMAVTFHRAIDEIDPVQGIKILSKYPQITNVLTSGGKKPLVENAAILKAMIASSGHIKVIVGGGLRIDNIALIKEIVQAPQYHLGTSVRVDQSPFTAIQSEQLQAMLKIIEG